MQLIDFALGAFASDERDEGRFVESIPIAAGQVERPPPHGIPPRAAPSLRDRAHDVPSAPHCSNAGRRSRGKVFIDF